MTESVPRSSTPAGYLHDRQRQYPPRYQRHDGGAALFRGALRHSSVELRSLHEHGLIAGGEVGQLAPVACVVRIGRGHAVEMYSGMMRLIYSCSRAILATDSGRFRDGERTPALTAEQTAGKIAELFKNYSEQEIATAQEFPVTQGQMGWANAIATHAEAFLLMHELAHVHNEHLSWHGRLWSMLSSQYGLETRADTTASRWLISYLLNPPPGGPPRQMFYAGAEFGLRVRMAMETVGMTFEDTHPAAGDRVAALRASLRAAAGSRTFYAIANTSIAFDLMWRAIEAMLLARAPVFEYMLEDVLASLRTVVQELLEGSDPKELVSAKPVEGEPGKFQMVLSLKRPEKVALLNAAAEDLSSLTPELRQSAREHASDLYELGSLEFSLVHAVLNAAER